MVSAEITYEVWVRDYAYPEKSVEFDATKALDMFKLSELPDSVDKIHHGELYYGDDIFRAAVSVGLIEDWYGPFTCHLLDQEEYEAYLDNRRAAEQQTGVA